MGFDTIMAGRALQLVKGDVQKAIEELIQKGGILPPTPEESSPSTGEKDTDRALFNKTIDFGLVYFKQQYDIGLFTPLSVVQSMAYRAQHLCAYIVGAYFT